MKALILFPHQLFEEIFSKFVGFKIYLVEHPLFFTQYRFHKQKLILHRASMSDFAEKASTAGFEAMHCKIDMFPNLDSVAKLIQNDGIKEIALFDPTDDWLNRDIETTLRTEFNCTIHSTPMFLTDLPTLEDFFKDKKRFRMAEFYTFQRKRLKILVDEKGKPEGGKWSFDEENRKKLPKKINIPSPPRFPPNIHVDEAQEWVQREFSDNYGNASGFEYPVTHQDAQEALQYFLTTSLVHFGAYEDAMSEREGRVFHSVLTPALNIGLLTPVQVVRETLLFVEKNPVPLNSLEGFLRQIIGWREFVRAMYVKIGSKQRTRNYFKFSRKIPETFWAAETGLRPADIALKRVLETGYCHHIERLMIFGNLMLLCEFDPDEVYVWFMTLFIDAYDWVMVPNVYGMSQYADGGIMTTKPYVSGSAYLKRMSDFKEGDWSPIWDALYWRFVYNHLKVFNSNQRVNFTAITLEKMKDEVLEAHLGRAEGFLNSLDAASKVEVK